MGSNVRFPENSKPLPFSKVMYNRTQEREGVSNSHGGSRLYIYIHQQSSVIQYQRCILLHFPPLFFIQRFDGCASEEDKE